MIIGWTEGWAKPKGKCEHWPITTQYTSTADDYPDGRGTGCGRWNIMAHGEIGAIIPGGFTETEGAGSGINRYAKQKTDGVGLGNDVREIPHY